MQLQYIYIGGGHNSYKVAFEAPDYERNASCLMPLVYSNSSRSRVR
jgi:hypothetical protein